VRQVVLREHRDGGGVAPSSRWPSWRPTAHFGSLATTRPARVGRIQAPAITSYEWVYVIPADRHASLVEALGGQAGDDVLALLVAYYQQHVGSSARAKAPRGRSTVQQLVQLTPAIPQESPRFPNSPL
jgi:hypothetical protein